jgi:hypothetical protein
MLPRFSFPNAKGKALPTMVLTTQYCLLTII